MTADGNNQYDFAGLGILVADMESSKFVNKVNYGGGAVISGNSTDVTAIHISITSAAPAANDHTNYDLKVTATKTGLANSTIKYVNALAATSNDAETLTSGTQTVVATSTVDQAVALDVYIWLDGVSVSAYESGTFTIAFETALHA